MALIIGFTGKIGVGKTTLAKMITATLNNNGYPTAMANFGDSLRYSMHHNLNIPIEVLYRNDYKDKPIKEIPGYQEFMPDIQGCKATSMITEDDFFRRVYQEYSHACRSKNPDCWIDLFQERVKLLESIGIQIIVVDDIRQDNELDLCSSNGAVFRIAPYDGYKDLPSAQHYVESGFCVDDDRIQFEVEVPAFGLDALENVAAGLTNGILQSIKTTEFETILRMENL